MEKFIPYQSDQLNELYTALSKAQKEMEDAQLNSKNPHFKSEYADLTSVVKAARPALTRNGLAVIQQLMIDPAGQTIMQTRLCHVSGQWIESRVPIKPEKEGIQALGSYISYIRRYSFTSLIGVVDADDDGESSEGRGETKMNVVPHAKPTEPAAKMSSDQLNQLLNEIGQDSNLLNKILNNNKIGALADLPPKEFKNTLEFVQYMKKNRSKQ